MDGETTAPLRLLSWNLFGAPYAPDAVDRMRRIAEWIAAGGHDLALLQEVWTDEQGKAIESVLAAEYDLHTLPHRALTGRKGGLMALVRRDSRWRLSGDTQFHEFAAEAPDAVIWQGDGIADKGVQQVPLSHAELELDLVLLHTHLQAPYSPRFLFDYESVRRAQLAELESVARRVDGCAPVLAAGDFNLGPHRENYARLTSYWRDLSKTERERCACGTHDGETGGAADWIDYLLARDAPSWRIEAEVTRLARGTGEDMLSDHDGLDARIQLFPRLAGAGAVECAVLSTLAGPTTRRSWLVLTGSLLARVLGL